MPSFLRSSSREGGHDFRLLATEKSALKVIVISSQAFSKCFSGIGRSSTREHDLEKMATRARREIDLAQERFSRGREIFHNGVSERTVSFIFRIFLFMLCITKLLSVRRKISQQTTFSDTSCVTCLFTLQIVHTTRS